MKPDTDIELLRHTIDYCFTGKDKYTSVVDGLFAIAEAIDRLVEVLEKRGGQ